MSDPVLLAGGAAALLVGSMIVFGKPKDDKDKKDKKKGKHSK